MDMVFHTKHDREHGKALSKEEEKKNGFIVANNSKRKNGKVEFKKIPITPMLKPYLEIVNQNKRKI